MSRTAMVDATTPSIRIPGAVLDECRVCHQRVTDFEEGGYERSNGQRGHFECDRGITYRVLDLNARKTIARGLSWGQAHQLIEQGRAADPAARFDIRTEIAS